MTLDVYAGLFADDLDKVAERMDAAARTAWSRPVQVAEVIELPVRASRT
jgi:hypothetical protein